MTPGTSGKAGALRPTGSQTAPGAPDIVAAILEATSDAVVGADAQQRIVLVNDETVRLFGFAREELLGADLSILLPRGAAESHARLIQKFFDSGERSRMVGDRAPIAAQRRNGESFFAQATLMRLEVPGTGTVVAAFMRDITGRLEVEKGLRESQRSLAAAQRIARIGHWDWEIATGGLAWSDEIYRVFGLEPQEFEPTYDAFLECVYPEDRALLQHSIDSALLGEPSSVDHRIVRPDGSIRTVHETGEVTFVGDSPVRMIGTCQDVTEARETQETLARSEATLRALFDGAQEAIFLWDQDGRVLNFNEAARALVQRTTGANLERGLRAADVLPPQLVLDLGPRFGPAPESRAFEVSSQVRTVDGSPCWVEASYSPVRPGEGKVAGVALIVRDTTARKRVEEQLLHSQKMESVGRLAGGVAHDFNNLLTAILGYAHLARASTGDDDRRAEDLREITSAAERAANLTRQLLMFARQQVGEPRTVEMTALLEGMHRLLRRLIGEDIEMVTFFADDLWPVHIDPSQLEQVIVNLAVNASDAMPNGGKLSLVVENVTLKGEIHAPELPAGDYVCLSVTDTGNGIAPSDLPHIFEPFFTTKDVGKGTGLGLATSFGIVQAAGGHITVESRPKKKTKFSVYLPRAAGESVAAVPDAGNARLSRGAGTVLLVEDEPQIRAIACRVLTSLGYQVIEAAHGTEALAVLEARQVAPDVLLTDIVMPQMNGWELAERVRVRHPGLAVVYMSGYSQDMDRLEGDGLSRFVAKPFSAETLSVAVREAVAGTSARP